MEWEAGKNEGEPGRREGETTTAKNCREVTVKGLKFANLHPL